MQHVRRETSLVAFQATYVISTRMLSVIAHAYVGSDKLIFKFDSKIVKPILKCMIEVNSCLMKRLLFCFYRLSFMYTPYQKNWSPLPECNKQYIYGMEDIIWILNKIKLLPAITRCVTKNFRTAFQFESSLYFLVLILNIRIKIRRIC